MVTIFLWFPLVFLTFGGTRGAPHCSFDPWLPGLVNGAAAPIAGAGRSAKCLQCRSLGSTPGGGSIPVDTYYINLYNI
jgi:hypothetical protein